MKSLGGSGIFLSRSLVEESSRSRFRPKSGSGARLLEKTRAAPPQKLVAQLQFLRDRLIAGQINGLQIIEQAAALADHQKQATARAVIFLIRLQMAGQMVDPLGQQRDLDIGRTGVLRVRLKCFNRLCLRFHR